MPAFAIEAAGLQTPRDEAPFYRWTFPDGTVWTEFCRIPSGYLLRFPDLADYTVSGDGKRVSCRPVPGVSDETIRHLYLNQVLPLALSRLGKLVLHASAVNVGGRAAVFMAESGRGKSTLAASFAINGCAFLTDDGLVLEETGNGYDVLPSHPSIRLWEDSQSALVPPGAPELPRLSYTPKARFLAGDHIAYCAEPRPLHRVYVLGQNAARLVINKLSPSEALIELVKHSFLLDIEARELVASQFDQLSRLVRLPIYFRLDFPRHFHLLRDVRTAVLHHCQT